MSRCCWCGGLPGLLGLVKLSLHAPNSQQQPVQSGRPWGISWLDRSSLNAVQPTGRVSQLPHRCRGKCSCSGNSLPIPLPAPLSRGGLSGPRVCFLQSSWLLEGRACLPSSPLCSCCVARWVTGEGALLLSSLRTGLGSSQRHPCFLAAEASGARWGPPSARGARLCSTTPGALLGWAVSGQ